MYTTGMILHGTSKKIGNLWMVYDGPQQQIALLWDGKNKRFCTDFNHTKHDIIRSQLAECDLPFATILTGQPLALFPQWARDLISTINPTPGVLKQVNHAFGIKEKPAETKTRVNTDCQKSFNGAHDYVSYTGLNESFDYCKNCDNKRSIVRSS